MHAAAGEERVGSDEEGIGALARKGGKGRIDLADRRGVEDLDLQPDGGGGFLHVPQRGLGGRSIGRIDEHGNTNGLGHQVMQQPQPLGRHLAGEKIDAGRVAAGPGEAGDKTKLDRVFADAEDDRDRRCCSFGRERSGRDAGRGDHGHTAADQIGHQCRQAIVLALQPVVLDRHVLAFDVAGFVEAFAERGHIARGGIGRPAVDKPDHRQRRLLRARRERPVPPLRREA